VLRISDFQGCVGFFKTLTHPWWPKSTANFLEPGGDGTPLTSPAEGGLFFERSLEKRVYYYLSISCNFKASPLFFAAACRDG
jgi:hypothetical protein